MWTSFLLGTIVQFPENFYVVLNYEGGYLKILVVTVLVLICSHWFDLYDPAHFNARGELYFRLLLVPGLLALLLSFIGYFFPRFLIGNGSALTGLIILTIALLGWRTAYSWLLQQPYRRSDVCTGERRARPKIGTRSADEPRSRYSRCGMERSDGGCSNARQRGGGSFEKFPPARCASRNCCSLRSTGSDPDGGVAPPSSPRRQN